MDRGEQNLQMNATVPAVYVKRMVIGFFPRVRQACALGVPKYARNPLTMTDMSRREHRAGGNGAVQEASNGQK